ncbi:hypothetical protein JG688_00004025 [Phytophthora aleatoria]|uniref:Uncharacterized protein n=1 Tax=Phytophthora aleatoria TaxID=2496075 RepID=A0A8J5J1B3_9STRA|nr:hypothetical protein JG688_00004025 [Phytophthora aleatoria]
MTSWIEEFARAVESGAALLDSVQAREEAVDKILAVLTKVESPTAKKDEGRLLLEILQLKHPDVSPLNGSLVELKNKVMEVFMLLPGSLLVALIQQQHQENADLKEESMLLPVLDHLHAMLLVVRIEKTRPLKDLLSTLIVCHNLAKTGDRDILACFKKNILPTDAATSSFDRTKALFFKHLKFFLTCLDTDVRRYTSELLFLLCDENAKEFTHHTGVGNAIGLLRTKGLA